MEDGGELLGRQPRRIAPGRHPEDLGAAHAGSASSTPRGTGSASRTSRPVSADRRRRCGRGPRSCRAHAPPAARGRSARAGTVDRRSSGPGGRTGVRSGSASAPCRAAAQPRTSPRADGRLEHPAGDVAAGGPEPGAQSVAACSTPPAGSASSEPTACRSCSVRRSSTSSLGCGSFACCVRSRVDVLLGLDDVVEGGAVVGRGHCCSVQQGMWPSGHSQPVRRSTVISAARAGPRAARSR